jgi:RimJ/RimL family protein N-acetyltransferase
MNFSMGDFTLRRPEPADIDALYIQKNDPEVARLLGGFSTGYSREDLRHWMEHHRTRRDEVLWTIAAADGACLGHVGLYGIDYRIRTAEFAIMIGERSAQGKGIGRRCTTFVVEYAFSQLNLNRVSLQVLESNERAIKLYRSVGFIEEGRLRQAQYKDGRYLDVVVMSVLRSESGSR